MDGGVSLPEMMRIARNLQSVKMYSIAVCVVVWYDMALTFAEEVEKIWQQRFTLVTILWALNRYVPAIGFIVVTVSFQMPWPPNTCMHYVLYPEWLKLVTLTTVNVIFILRLYAIYFRHRAVLYLFVPLLFVCIGIKIWAFTDGVVLKLPPGLAGCILIGAHPAAHRFVYTFVADLIFDTAVFIATLFRTITLYRRDRAGTSGSLLTVMMRDGIVYFAIIFVANLTTVMLYLFAAAELKVLNVTFSALITNLAASKLMLNLKRATNKGVITEADSKDSKLIGNLGNPLGYSGELGENGTPNAQIQFPIITDADESVSSKEVATRTPGEDSYEICEVPGRWEPRLVRSPDASYEEPAERAPGAQTPSFSRESRPSSPEDGRPSPSSSPVQFAPLQGTWQAPLEWTEGP